MTALELDYVALIGGSVSVRGGVEQFAARLLQSWPADAQIVAFSSFSNTAYRRHSDGPLAGIWLFSRTLIGVARKLRRLTRRGSRRVTLVVHYGNALDVSYVLIAGLVGVRKTIVIAHCSPHWAHLRSPILRRLVARALRSASVLVTLSAQQQKFFRKLGLRQLRSFPTLLGEALDDYPRHPFAKRVARTLVFSGRISREKGALDAIELILELIRKSGETWSLDYFGEIDGDIKREFAEAVEFARAHSALITLHGHVESSLLFAKLGKSRFVVYLSKQDAFPLSVLEAIAAGALPIVYDLPGTVEIIEKWGGIAVAPGSMQDIVERVLAIERGSSSFEVDLGELRKVYGLAAIQSELRMLLAQVN